MPDNRADKNIVANVRERPTLAGEALSGVAAMRPFVKEQRRANFIAQVAYYLTANNGPDEHGRAHQKTKRISVSILENAISAAEKMGMVKGVRAYDINGHYGTYAIPNYVDEVLSKKCIQVLAGRFRGRVHRFITGVEQEDLLAPLIDHVGNRNFPVSMHAIAKKFDVSPYKMVKHFCEISPELREYATQLRPYHMHKAPAGTYDDPEIVREVLAKKIRHEVRDKHKGDFHRFVTHVTQDDILSDFPDYLVGKRVMVSFKAVAEKYLSSPYALVIAYCSEHPEYADYARELRPFHMHNAALHTYDDERLVDELVIKKIESLLSQSTGEGAKDTNRVLTAERLREPLNDTLCGRPVEVSMSRLMTHFGNSPTRMIDRYNQLKNSA